MSEYTFRFPTIGGDLSGSRGALLVRPYRRLWLHILLFILTAFTTVAVGALFAWSFQQGIAGLDLWRSFSAIWKDPQLLFSGIAFSAAVLAILLAHEMGHYLACRHYGVAATYPYFIPAPTIIGTLGAFIRIKSAIASRRALFDIGIAGPLAGFAVTLPVLIAGVLLSRPVLPPTDSDTIHFTSPLLLVILQKLFHFVSPEQALSLHPLAVAAWVGLFATALNLLPIGQLDGGHILYAVMGERHRPISHVFAVALLPLTYLTQWYGWLAISAVLLILGMRHPAIFDPVPLDANRRWLALLALAIFIVCFVPNPLN